MRQLTRRDTLKYLATGAIAGSGEVVSFAGENRLGLARSIEEWPAVDVFVCGGGPAGISAALMAAALRNVRDKTLLVRSRCPCNEERDLR